MSVSTYVVTGTSPVQVHNDGYPETTTVYNKDTANTVYLLEYPQGFSTGFPLGPGSTITWDKGKALYLCCDNAATTINVVVADNGGTLTDAGAIAGQIIAQGLATDIATQISLTGAPPIDVNTIIKNIAFTTNTTSTYSIDVPNVEQYQSVTIWAVDEGNASLRRDISVQHGVLSGAVLALYYDEGFGIVDQGPGSGYLGGYTTYRTSTKQQDLRVNVGPSGAATTVHFIVTGSYKAVDRPEYINRSPIDPPSAGVSNIRPSQVGVKYTAPAAGSYAWTGAPCKNGPAVLVVTSVGAGSTAVVLYSPTPTYSQNLNMSVSSTGNVAQSTEVKLPAYPLGIFLTVTGVVSSCVVTVIFDP